jgi:N-acetylmuramoyl-L-alanine amidase
VKFRRFQAYLPLLALLLLPVLGVAQSQRAPAPPVPPSSTSPRRGPSVSLEDRELAVPVVITPAGPLVALEPLAQALGGRLLPGETGESFTLRLGDRDVVLGIGSSVVTVGEKIVSLSQPPTRGPAGVQVPLDFLNETYGDLQGYSFEWRPEQQLLTIGRRSAREIPVALDVVHLQGTTTVVLQFPAQPRYRIDQEPGRVEVLMTTDRLAVPAPRRIDDPLVRAIDIAPDGVRLALVPGAEVESYVLDNPFRLVFDIHERTALAEPAVPPGLPPALPPGIRTIVLDPGHGGRETGAVGPSGTFEKDLTLQLAEALAARLQRLGVRAVLTRGEDAALPLDTRTAIANQNKADLFVSIHLNSSLGAGAHGAETYFLSTRASDPRAASAAQAENAPPPPAGTEAGTEPAGDVAAQQALELILWDLAQSHHLAESQRFANLVQGELNQTLQLKDRGVKQAPFRVLMGATMPAVLVELGFLSNPEEEAKLLDPAYRGELVEALVRAIGRYKEAVEGVPAAPSIAQPAPSAPSAKPQARGASPP